MGRRNFKEQVARIICKFPAGKLWEEQEKPWDGWEKCLVECEFDFKVSEPPSGAAERQLQGCGDAQSKSCAAINPNFNGMENGANLPLELWTVTPTLTTNKLQ